jgi:hypothetical protein
MYLSLICPAISLELGISYFIPRGRAKAVWINCRLLFRSHNKTHNLLSMLVSKKHDVSMHLS